MTVCAVKGCHNKSEIHKKESNITFHVFPSDPDVAARWTEKIRQNRNKPTWSPSKHTKICSAHFDDSEKYITKLGFCKILPGTVPSKGLHIKCSNESHSSNDVGRTGANQDLNPHQDSHASTSSATQGPPSVSEILDGKVLIFRVYSYLFNEYEEIKAYTRNICDLSPLSNILRRTAGATGVSEHVVATILDEKRKGNDEVPEKRARLSIEVESASSQTEAAISYDIPIDVVPATICGVPAPIVEIVPSVKVEIEPEEIQYPQYVPCEGHVTISVEPLPQVSEQPSCSSADTGIWTGTPVQVKSEPPDEDEYTTSSFSSEHTHDFTDPSRDPQLRTNTETQHTQYQYAEFGDAETGIATRVTVKAEPADM